MGVPTWCHHHGSKMRVEEFDKTFRSLRLAGSAARLTIIPWSGDIQKWLVVWEVIQSSSEKAVGSVVFSSDDLRSAFGLSDESTEFSLWLIDLYGGDSARQGKYIRWKEFLNIPCPGTGHDGDPNVSIHIDGEMANAVRSLLGE